MRPSLGGPSPFPRLRTAAIKGYIATSSTYDKENTAYCHSIALNPAITRYEGFTSTPLKSENNTHIVSFYGAGKLLKIPKIIDLPEILQAKKLAIGITIAGLICIFVFQGFLVWIRWEQIQDKEGALVSEKKIYDDIIEGNEFQSRSDSDQMSFRKDFKPDYKGNRIMDYLSIIVPIATTVLSFWIGMINARGFDKFEKDAERIRVEMETLEGQLDEWSKKANKNINALQTAGNIENLKEIILSDINKEDTNALGNFINNLENNFRNRAPELYEIHIKKLIPCLEEISHKICQDLSEGADDPDIIMNIDLVKDFNYKLNTLETPKKIF